MAEQLANLQKNGLDEYSTTEKIVGTWIDGTPVYRCVWDIPAISPNSIGVVATIANIRPIKYFGYIATPDNPPNIITLPYSGRGVYNNILTDAVFAYYSGGKINVATGSYRTVASGKLVVDYIKTS